MDVVTTAGGALGVAGSSVTASGNCVDTGMSATYDQPSTTSTRQASKRSGCTSYEMRTNCPRSRSAMPPSLPCTAICVLEVMVSGGRSAWVKVPVTVPAMEWVAP